MIKPEVDIQQFVRSNVDNLDCDCGLKEGQSSRMGQSDTNSNSEQNSVKLWNTSLVSAKPWKTAWHGMLLPRQCQKCRQ